MNEKKNNESVMIVNIFDTIRKQLLYVSSVVILVGCILDFFTRNYNVNNTEIINLIAVSAVIIALVVYFFKKEQLRLSFGILIYGTLVTFFSYAIIDANVGSYDNSFLIITLYATLLMTFSGFLIGKIHFIIILFLYYVVFAYVLIVAKSEFLMNRAPMLFMVLPGYMFLLFRLQTLIEKVYHDKIKFQIEIEEKNKLLETKNKELNDLNISKDKFFSIIAHDLKNPISTLTGFLGLIQYKGDKITQEKLQSYISNAIVTSQNISSLLNDLLDWARSQSNYVSVQTQKFEIAEVIESVFFFLKMQADKKNISLEHDIPAEQNVIADYNMIFTVLRNLISNAIKFSHDNKKVSVRSERLENEMLKISIADEGIGMSDDFKNSLFKINQRPLSRGTHNEVGTGLGIILSKEFVQKNHGDIGVISSEGHGSTFWFTIPTI